MDPKHWAFYILSDLMDVFADSFDKGRAKPLGDKAWRAAPPVSGNSKAASWHESRNNAVPMAHDHQTRVWAISVVPFWKNLTKILCAFIDFATFSENLCSFARA